MDPITAFFAAAGIMVPLLTVITIALIRMNSTQAKFQVEIANLKADNAAIKLDHAQDHNLVNGRIDITRGMLADHDNASQPTIQMVNRLDIDMGYIKKSVDSAVKKADQLISIALRLEKNGYGDEDES